MFGALQNTLRECIFKPGTFRLRAIWLLPGDSYVKRINLGRYLVDAVCINQADTNEKNSQVYPGG